MTRDLKNVRTASWRLTLACSLLLTSPVVAESAPRGIDYAATIVAGWEKNHSNGSRSAWAAGQARSLSWGFIPVLIH